MCRLVQKCKQKHTHRRYILYRPIKSIIQLKGNLMKYLAAMIMSMFAVTAFASDAKKEEKKDTAKAEAKKDEKKADVKK